MSFKFYLFVAIAALSLAAIVYVKAVARRRAHIAEEEKAAEEARKNAPPPLEMPPQVGGDPAWRNMTPEEIDRRIRGTRGRG